MASVVLINPTISLDGTDVSTYVKEVQLGVEAADVEDTTFGPDGWVTRKSGLKSGDIQLTFVNDYDSAAVDDLLWGWFGTTIPLAIRADAAVVGVNNPQYSGSVVVLEMQPLAGAVGDLAEQSLTWQLTGPLARATS